mgnify:FL=1
MSNKHHVIDHNDMLALFESVQTTIGGYGIDLEDGKNFKNILEDTNLQDLYIEGFSEGINEDERRGFNILAKNIMENMVGLAENTNTSLGFLPQARMIMPLFRFMWPKMIMREFLTTVPLDSPEAVRYFFKPVAKTLTGQLVELPSYSPLGMGTPVGSWNAPFAVNVPSSTDLLTPVGLNSNNASIERKVVIVSWAGVDAAGATTGPDAAGDVNLVVDEEGKFQFSHTFPASGGAGPFTDVVTGTVNFEDGIISLSGTRSVDTVGKITSVGIVATATTAEENNAIKVGFDSRKIRFNITDLQMQADWSVQYEQDMKSRMGLQMQAEFIAVFGNQSQLSLDVALFQDLLFQTTKYNPTNVESFNANPTRAAFGYTVKEWANELLFKIERVSARIYNATNLTPATHMLINPMDMVWLRMLNSFDFKGSYDKDGQFGSSPEVGTLSNYLTVLCSPIVPAGRIVIGAKPAQESFANYIFAPYIPMTIYPYPLGNRPALTFLSRFGNEMLRPEGYGIVNIIY